MNQVYAWSSTDIQLNLKKKNYVKKVLNVEMYKQTYTYGGQRMALYPR